ncbi:Phosphoglycerol transferase MdoB [Parelusimicrobium proximum]|uniref:LTA synthase family protein n=1 Tax=Parelusimicrobium proximum TaxID=3228953 RepID=UPI003D168249
MYLIKAVLGEFKSTLRENFIFTAVMALPGLAVAVFGFYQLGVFDAPTVLAGGLQKAVCEFLFIFCIISFMYLIGLRNKFIIALFFLAYIVCAAADWVLLFYFKERFGAKYFSTLDAGADFSFFTDWRVILLCLGMLLYAALPVKFLLKKMSKPKALFSFAEGGILLAVISFIPFYNLLPPPSDFYAKHMLAPMPVYLAQTALIKQRPVLTELNDYTAPLAGKYNLFKHDAAPEAQSKYDRVIVLTIESLSVKFINKYNANVPANASPALSSLMSNYPSTSVKTGALSTLYGLSILFSGHPNAKASYLNAYPLSYVKMLRSEGYETVFLRGAKEDYMDENIHFREAGFNTILGQYFFEEKDDYKDYISWWGLTDRKLYQYAVEYLKENKNKKTYLHILTVDTHVPVGRLDYMGQEYPPLPDTAAYAKPSMAAAFARADYDLGLFIENLKKENLLDDKTLLVVTGDHPFFSVLGITDIVKGTGEEADYLPVVFITKDKIPRPLTKDAFTSQADIAPTLLDILGIEKPKGMFGNSLFENKEGRTVFDIKDDYMIISNNEEKKYIVINSRKHKAENDLINTFLK